MVVVVVVMVTAVVRVAVVVWNNLSNGIFNGGICGIGSVSGSNSVFCLF